MKEEVIERPFQKFDQSKLDELESILGEKLPEDYVEFLRKYNGGYAPEENSYDYVEYGEETTSNIANFYGLTDEILYDLRKEALFIGDRVPPDCLPIGADSFGNSICLVFKGPNKGKIYFWDHEMEADPDQGETPDYSNMSLIANSFTEFIDNLYRYELPEDEDEGNE